MLHIDAQATRSFPTVGAATGWQRWTEGWSSAGGSSQSLDGPGISFSMQKQEGAWQVYAASLGKAQKRPCEYFTSLGRYANNDQGTAQTWIYRP